MYLASLERHAAFLQHDRPAAGRRGGLHELLASLFPVERTGPTRITLDYLSYELTPQEDALALYVNYRLAHWAATGATIDDAVEQPVIVCLLSLSDEEAYCAESKLVGAGESPDAFAAHLTALVTRMADQARQRIMAADRDTTPGDLVFDEDRQT